MPQGLQTETEDLDVSQDVETILCEHLIDQADSPTGDAMAKGWAKVIIRDAANDDEAEPLAALA